eukprot:jgi/Chlat1/7764/Chrsp66S07227
MEKAAEAVAVQVGKLGRLRAYVWPSSKSAGGGVGSSNGYHSAAASKEAALSEGVASSCASRSWQEWLVQRRAVARAVHASVPKHQYAWETVEVAETLAYH